MQYNLEYEIVLAVFPYFPQRICVWPLFTVCADRLLIFIFVPVQEFALCLDEAVFIY